MRHLLRLNLFVSLLLLLAFIPAAAHPGVGIVMDSQGNLFYTDLKQVWRIAPDGRKTVAVPDVHAHELGLDGAGNLIGEDSEFLGGDRFRHRIWRLGRDGQLSDIVGWREGFWRDFSFVRDGRGNMYLVRCEGTAYCTVKKRTPLGYMTDAAPGVRFGRGLNWLAAGAKRVYVADGRDLRWIDEKGRVGTSARGLGESGAPGIFGLFVDPEGNVYAAVYSSRSVVRVSPKGVVKTVARTPSPWAPTGVTGGRDGDLWVLEYSTTNEARVRRISRHKRETIY